MRLKLLNKIYKISYQGKIFSLNDLYRQGHWSIRSTLKNKYKKLFLELIHKQEIKYCKQFYIIVFYNTRHDPDNIIGVVKVFVDAMKGEIIPDDNKKHFKGVSIFPDNTLSANTVDFLLIEKSTNED